MRVIAGSLGGRRLTTPRGADTRPTSELVRGAICNSLDAQGALDGARVADLFAGSGALGIEALSRGAAAAVFVEHGKAALQAIRHNLDALALEAEVVGGPVERWLATGARALDVVFADPPYGYAGWASLLDALAGFPARLVVAEAEVAVEHASWDVVAVRRYGDTVVSQLAQRGAA